VDRDRARASIRAAAAAEFSRSGGPGGQNVNKVNTRVTLRLPVAGIAGLSEAESARLRDVLAGRITAGGDLLVSVTDERSQRVNLERAYARLEDLVIAAARLPRRRRPTRPSRAARERVLESKRRRGAAKAARRAVSDE